jgi:hypothetical protein
MTVERVVQLTHKGRSFTFRADNEPPFPLAFWRAESEDRVYRSACRIECLVGHQSRVLEHAVGRLAKALHRERIGRHADFDGIHPRTPSRTAKAEHNGRRH